MKTLALIVTIFGAVLVENVSGAVMCTMSIKNCPQGQYWGRLSSSECPDCHDCPLVNLEQCEDGSSPQPDAPVANKCQTYTCSTKPVVACPAIYKYCPQGQFWGTLSSDECPDCHDCPLVKLAPCADGSYPQPSAYEQNKCPTYSCKKKPVFCTMIAKLCPKGQFWGTLSSDECPDCHQCPLVKLAPCADGSYPQPSAYEQNKCPTYSCKKKPVLCTMIVKLCPQGQFWGTLSSDECPDCHDCPLVNLAQCADGSYPQPSAYVQNKCPIYSCPNVTSPTPCELE